MMLDTGIGPIGIRTQSSTVSNSCFVSLIDVSSLWPVSNIITRILSTLAPCHRETSSECMLSVVESLAACPYTTIYRLTNKAGIVVHAAKSLYIVEDLAK